MMVRTRWRRWTRQGNRLAALPGKQGASGPARRIEPGLEVLESRTLLSANPVGAAPVLPASADLVSTLVPAGTSGSKVTGGAAALNLSEFSGKLYGLPSATTTKVNGPSLLAITALPIHATVGTAFQGVVATFPAATHQATGSFHALINWGDGTPVSAGVVTQTNGQVVVYGSHTYMRAGSYGVMVKVSNATGTTGGQAGTMATVTLGVTAGTVGGVGKTAPGK
jgi:hypothetical protein